MLRAAPLLVALLGCGGGSKPPAEPVPLPPDEPVAETPASATGAEACDALIELQTCLTGDATTPGVIEKVAAQLRDKIASEATRQVTIDGCDRTLASLVEHGRGQGCTVAYTPVAPPARLAGEPTCDQLVIHQLCVSRDDLTLADQLREMVPKIRAELDDADRRDATIERCGTYLETAREEAARLDCDGLTGAIECDDLIVLQRCVAKSAPEAARAVEQMVPAFRDAIADPSSRQLTIEACTSGLVQLYDVAVASGC